MNDTPATPRATSSPGGPDSIAADPAGKPPAPREDEAADPVGDGHSDADYASDPPPRSSTREKPARTGNTSVEAPDPEPQRR
jgi:hypothetical protein